MPTADEAETGAAVPADPETLTYAAMAGVAVIVAAADRSSRAALSGLAAAHGGRVVAALDIAAAGERVTWQAGGFAVLADLRGVPPRTADGLMRALATQPAQPATLAIIDEAEIDTAYARMYAPWIELLVAPDDAAMAAATAILLAPRAPRLFDSAATATAGGWRSSARRSAGSRACSPRCRATAPRSPRLPGRTPPIASARWRWRGR